MSKKATILFILASVFVLAACSVLPSAQANSAANPSSQPQQANQANPPNGTNTPGNNLQFRLAIGTLKLEGTANAVTADEAKQLLPLWQKVETMSADTKTTQADYQTVYKQIEADMTSGQIQVIETMSLTQSDIQDMMQSLGIQITPGARNFNGTPGTGFFNGTPGAGQNGGNFSTLSPDERATRTAQRQTQAAGNGASGTPEPNRFGGRGGGFNTMFVSPLIKLLQARAGQ
jgi:hypothetical protein